MNKPRPSTPRAPGRFLAAALALALLLPSAADAARKKRAQPEPPKPPERALRVELVDPVIVDLPFDKDFEATMLWLKSRLEVVYGPRIKKALDTRERSAVRHALSDELRDLRGRLVKFEGHRTGFEVSIVSGEFVSGAEEAVLLFREGMLDHYLFFSHGKLWKYARPFPAGMPFEQRLQRFVADQGTPTATAKNPDVEADVVGAASWRGRRYNLRLEDRRLLYGADLIVLEARAIADRIDELRGGKAPATIGGEVDPDLVDFLDDGSEDELEVAPEDE